MEIFQVWVDQQFDQVRILLLDRDGKGIECMVFFTHLRVDCSTFVRGPAVRATFHNVREFAT
jgi:hypothetical protein